MSDDGMRELHVTAFDVEAGSATPGSATTPVPVCRWWHWRSRGRPSPDAGDESLRLRLQAEVAHALAAELIQEADHAEQLARRQNRA